MRSLLVCGSFLTAAAAIAQGPVPDGLWYLDNQLAQLVQVMTGGTEVRRIGLQQFGQSANGAYPAPDGRIWLSTSPIGRLYVVDPGPPVQFSAALPVPAGSAGVALTIAFAANGNAWVAYADGLVQTLTPAGLSGGLTQLAPQPVAAAFDHFGMLWIGNRGGLLSRLDPVTRQVTTFQLPLAANRQLRGFRIAPPAFIPNTNRFTLGALWAVDTGSTLFRLDLTGMLQSTWQLGPNGSPTIPGVDRSGQVWVGTGSQVYGFMADGAGLVGGFTFPGRQVRGIDFDAYGQMLVQKWDPLLQSGSIDATDPFTGVAFARIALNAAVSSDPARWYHALVVDRNGDADGDGIDNGTEVTFGLSPFDRQSNLGLDLAIQGQQRIGSMLNVVLSVGPAVIAVATGLLPAPIPVPGVGELRIDPAGIVSTTFVPSNYLPLVVPNNAALAGLDLVFQALRLPSPGFGAGLTNVVDLRLGL